MQNAQSAFYPGQNWANEISPAGAPQSTVHASTTTSTTTTSTATASAGHHGDGPTASVSTGQGQNSTQNQGQNGSFPQNAAPMPGVPAQPPAVPAAQGLTQNSAAPMVRPPASRSEFEGASGTLDLETHQPIEVIEAPASMNEAFLGSLKSMLMRNKGAFVTATFLIGTQGTTTWEGLLHDVGNDYIIIFQPGRQRYIASDIYSLKYIEFYDTKQREMCEHLLRANGLENYQ